MPNQKIFNQLFIFVNLYQHAQNEAVSSIRRNDNLEILQSDWLTAFSPVSQEQGFPKI